MKSNLIHLLTSRSKISLLIAAIMTGGGILIGFAIGIQTPREHGPSAVQIIRGLSTPLPVPEGATLLKSRRESCGVYLEKRGLERIAWSHRLILDVTNMTQTQIQNEVHKLYQAWFDNITGTPRGFYWDNRRSETVMISGALSYQKFSFVGGWTWGQVYHYITDHLHCEINTEVMDFDELRPGTDFPQRYPVEGPGHDVRRQRVMHIFLSLDARGLSDVERASKMTIQDQPDE